MHDVDGTPDARGLFALSSEQAGYFTSAQAHAQGYSPQLLGYHARQGRFERLRRGLYRLRDYPSSPREEVMAAWLAAGRDSAVVSHETALELLGLSDVTPATIHLLVPRGRRWVRALPGVTVHTTAAPLAVDEMVTRQGMRITAPMRTILDAADAGTAPEQVIMAVDQARARGILIPERLHQAAMQRGRRVRELIDRALEDGSEAAETVQPAEVVARCCYDSCAERRTRTWKLRSNECTHG